MTSTASSTARPSESDESLVEEGGRASAMLETLPFDVIYVDRTATIRYLNRAARLTLERIQEFLPVPPCQILGQPIDVLERLPEALELSVNPMLDDQGAYVGAVLTARRREPVECGELRRVVADLSTRSSKTSALAHDMSVRAETLKDDAARIRSAATRMEQSTQAIARRTSDAETAGTRGVEIAEETQLIVEQLRESSVQIGHLVSLVASIARQTSLLSLTAGIEAALTTDSASGIGVLANEVKVLAKQAGKASDQIRSRAASIHTSARAASAALSRIDEVIRELDAYRHEVVGAVREQHAVAADISANVAQVEAHSSRLAKTAAWVSQGAKHTEQGATDIRRTLDDAYGDRTLRHEA